MKINRPYEMQYEDLVRDILANGEVRQTRNGKVKSVFGRTLEIDLGGGIMPLLNGRKIFYNGILGEFCAMLRGPKNVKDFRAQGCNYWDLWADTDGNLTLDYGNAWLDFNGVNQLQNVIDAIKNNPTDRRMIITGWRPDRLDELSLPCCHYAYQFYVRDLEGKKCLDMLWHQRSVDTMIGLPSDMVFGSAFIIAMAAYTNTTPGRLIMTLGDTHIYEEHVEAAEKYLERIKRYRPPLCEFKKVRKHITEIEKEDFDIRCYECQSPIAFELKA